MKSFVPKRAIHQSVTFLYSSTNMFRVHTSRMRYISHLSEIIFLLVKKRIEIILFFKTHYVHLHFFPKRIISILLSRRNATKMHFFLKY